MKGNFAHTNHRPSLKKRLESLRRQNRALAVREAAARCAGCRGPLPKAGALLVALGGAQRYCSVLCLPPEAN